MVVDRLTVPSDTTSPLQWADQRHGEPEDAAVSCESTNTNETFIVNQMKEQYSREQVPDCDWPQAVPLCAEIDDRPVAERSTAVAGMSAVDTVDRRAEELAEESFNLGIVPEQSEAYLESIFDVADKSRDDPDDPSNALVEW